jgi:hypothetical protein
VFLLVSQRCWHGSTANSFSDDAQCRPNGPVQSMKQDAGDVQREHDEGELAV